MTNARRRAGFAQKTKPCRFITGGALVPTPGLEVDQAADCEPLAFLKELIANGLQRHDTLFRHASTAILDALENYVRLGWHLGDAKTYLKREEGYMKCVTSTFGISYSFANNLRHLSKHFCRNSFDFSERQKFGIKVKGLVNTSRTYVASWFRPKRKA
jgi:hypothetical protein